MCAADDFLRADDAPEIAALAGELQSQQQFELRLRGLGREAARLDQRVAPPDNNRILRRQSATQPADGDPSCHPPTDRGDPLPVSDDRAVKTPPRAQITCPGTRAALDV